MSAEDKAKWNDKHTNSPYPDISSPLLIEHIEEFRVGRALDIACGTGRHSRFLRDRGFIVDSVDFSDVALLGLKDEPNIIPKEVDLDSYKIEPNKYDLIVNIHFLQRRLFPYIKESLKVGGAIFFETFLEDSRTPLASFSNRDHLLRKNELLHAFISLDVIYYSEKRVTKFNNEDAYLASLIAFQK